MIQLKKSKYTAGKNYIRPRVKEILHAFYNRLWVTAVNEIIMLSLYFKQSDILGVNVTEEKREIHVRRLFLSWLLTLMY